MGFCLENKTRPLAARDFRRLGPLWPCSDRVTRRHFPALSGHCFEQNSGKRRCNVLGFGLICLIAIPPASFGSWDGKVALQVTWLQALKTGRTEL